MSVNNKRIEWIDIARGFAILLIILGHSNILNGSINGFIHSFHVPLFFVVSGLLFKGEDLARSIKKRGKQLLIPFYITGTIVVIGKLVFTYVSNSEIHIKDIINWIVALICGYGYDYDFFGHTIYAIGAIWFLWALFWSFVTLQIIFKLTKRTSEWIRALAVIIVSVIGYIIGQFFWIPTNIDLGLYCVIYLYFGYILKNYLLDYLKNNRIINYLIIAICIAIYVYASIINGLYITTRQTDTIISVLGALAGSLVCLEISMLFEKLQYVSKVIIWYGMNSLLIICVHNIEIMLITWDRITVQGILQYGFVVFIIRLLVISGIVAIINMIKQKRRT